jgi:hypothetical protein
MAPSSSFTKWSSIIGIAVVIFLLDWFYMLYITSHGFDLKAENFSVAGSSFPVQLQWLPVVGVVIVAFVALYEVSARIFPRRGIEIDPLGGLRLLRAVAFSLALFVCVLYVPYLIGSNWFWARLSELSRSVSQVQSFGLSLLSTDESVMALSPLWQYSLSQTLAPAAMVLSAWAFGRGGRRPRKQR